MDVETMLAVLHDQGHDPDGVTKQWIQEILPTISQEERAGLLTTLRRGASWREACTWLETAQRQASHLPEGVYSRAMQMYGDSVLLSWDECVRVAPALS